MATQLGQPRLELHLVDQSLGVAVDQSADALAHLGALTLKRRDLKVPRIGLDFCQTALVFMEYAGGICEQATNLCPHGGVELFDTDRTKGAAAPIRRSVIDTPAAAGVVGAAPISVREPVPQKA